MKKEIINTSTGIDINGDKIEDVIEKLSKYKGMNATLDINEDCGLTNIEIDYYREETDREYNERLKEEKRQEEVQIMQKEIDEMRDRQQYERLKKKFG